MTYSEAIQFLYQMGWFGAKLGLENPRKLAALAGDPQDRLRFIHVAGTNGKGSTCAMLENVYRAAGFRVGLYTSPHLVSFRERIQINRQLIPEGKVTRLVEEMQLWLKEFSQEAHPTFFEIVTVMALRHFAEQRCDLVIWETGLGGRLDATNIVTPLASVITNVQFDHEKWLGHTLQQIAFEKAGIIKPGVPVLTATDAPEALAVICETAAKQQAPLTVLAWPDAAQPPLDRLELPLLGDHQRLNALVALSTVRTLAPTLPVREEAIVQGLAGVRWPGRFQIAKTSPTQTVVLDGAHNPAGAETLRAGLQKYFPHRRPAVILGVMKDKDWTSMCRLLAPLADRLLLCPVASERTAPPQDLLPACRAANPTANLAVCASLTEALQLAAEAPFVVITGSLHFLGEAMERLRLLPGTADGERGLNDWSGLRR
ncbi:MAG: bifunctional folylpolyglutamate synthase/dihydrofolate synthase [Verrucomicrobia bacterium]|nr:bifunctional folylpolyglutamate synthase/dihydrofolate synthase [Verrucomicrobiota bacterium]